MSETPNGMIPRGQHCAALGHLYGHADLCMFCQQPKPVVPPMTPTLIAWEDVPDGHYVWWRYQLPSESEWRYGRKVSGGLNTLVQAAEACVTNKWFSRAEQQPGEAEAALTTLRAGIATLDTDALVRAVEYLDNYADTVDGPDSQPSPNAAMSLMSQLDELHDRLVALRGGQ